MNKVFLLTIFIFLANTSFSQDSTKTSKKKINIHTHGFIKSDYWYDSRQVVYARDGLFTLFPKGVVLDNKGNDINAIPSFNYSAITSRLNFKIDGLKAFGASTFAFIEADFSGMSNVSINTFRLRHAYLELDWKKSSLLLGQYWHPMFVSEVFPTVISLNTGAPFQPFIRSPQIRYTYRLKQLKIIAVALSQRDYSSKGPLGRSYTYLSNGLIPNLHLQIQYHKGKHLLGIAIDYKSLRPRLITDSNIITKSRVNSKAVMAFYKYKTSKVEFKTKVIYGENMTEDLMLGGYAVTNIDTATDRRNYSPTRDLFVWTNIIYHKKFKHFSLRPSLFIAYAKNLGTLSNTTNIFYATAPNIDKMYRIAPSISVKSGNTMFAFEWEYTSAFYGHIDDNATVSNAKPIANNRFIFTAFYFF